MENTAKRPLLTVADVADELGIPQPSVRRMIRLGTLPSAKLNERVYAIPRAAFDAWLNAKETEALAEWRQ